MANIRVLKRLDNITRELRRVLDFITQYHGVPREEAMAIDREATEIATVAARIAADARAAMGDRSAGKLTQKVRKSLGFTYP